MVKKPPSVTRKVAGRPRNMGSVSGKASVWPNARPTLKHPLMKPASRAMARPLGKLKSLTAAFFSSSDREALFMEPATPMTAMPTSVTTTPMMTAMVSLDSGSCSGKKTLRNTGPRMVPRPAQVPRAMLWPRATPR